MESPPLDNILSQINPLHTYGFLASIYEAKEKPPFAETRGIE
jgi:hypothetical protein